jgi:hypothetical protein
VQQQADALEHLERALTEPVEDLADPDRGERPVLVGQRAQGRAGATEQEHRPDDVEDHEQRQVRRAEVRAEEPRAAAHLLGLVAQADEVEDEQAAERHHRDEVLEETEDGPGADQRDRPAEVLALLEAAAVEEQLEQRAVGLEVDGRQDEEGPHHEEVRGSRHRPLEHLLLPEDLDDLALHRRTEALGHTCDAVGGRLADLGHPVEEDDSFHRQRQRDRVHQQSEDQHPEHL